MTEFLIKTSDIFGGFLKFFSKTFSASRIKCVIHLKNKNHCYGDLADFWFHISNVRTRGQHNSSHF